MTPTPPATFEPLAEQDEAIRHTGGPLLIVAGAGSGKTTVMAHRIVHLVQHQGWRPDQILGLTFSNKAAANLRERITQTLGPGAEATVTTYHGFGGSIVREFAPEIGLQTLPRLIDKAQAWQLLYDALDDVEIEHRKTGRLGNLIRDALMLNSSCADYLVSTQTVLDDCERLIADRAAASEVAHAARNRRDLARLSLVYEQAKRRYGFIDFGDQLQLAVRAVQQNQQLAELIRARHPVVLLDEYQDTNFAQRRLIEILYRSSPNITAVGDDMQSIYGFRGAHIRNILEFEQSFPGTTVRRLETNHRSGDAVVQLANHIQARVPTARKKTLKAVPTAPLSVIEMFASADDLSEAQSIAAHCKQLGEPWSSIAILCRKRKIMATIVGALTTAGIPAEVIGMGGLLQRPEVIDVVSWLEILAADDSSVALLRVLRGPQYRFGLRDLAALARSARRRRAERDGTEAPTTTGRIDLIGTVEELEAVHDLSTEGWSRGKEFLSTRQRLQAVARTSGLVDTVEAIVQENDLWHRVDEQGHENLLRFLHLAAEFSPLPKQDVTQTWQCDEVRQFLEYLQLVVESEDELGEAVATGNDAIRVMTVHQSKGLEFDNVFVAGLAGDSRSSIFPDERMAENGVTQSWVLPPWLKPDNEGSTRTPRLSTDIVLSKRAAKSAQLDEETRLLYVATTRARRRLIFSGAHWYPGPAKPQGLSTFYKLISERSDLVSITSFEQPTPNNPAVAAKLRLQAEYRTQDRKRDGQHVDALGQAKPTPPERPNPQTESPAIRSGKGKGKGKGRKSVGLGQGLLLQPSQATTQTDRAHSVPLGLSPTALVSYARCPKEFFWTTVRPLPRSGSVAAQIGVAVHRWIEEQASRQLAMDFDDTETEELARAGTDDRDELDQGLNRELNRELDSESRENVESNIGSNTEQNVEPASAVTRRIGVLRERFLASEYASVDPDRFEAPFSLPFGTHVLRGRIDATYRNGEVLEIVDFKTGRRPDRPRPDLELQLEIYGLVAVRAWNVDPSKLITSFCWLGGDEVEVRKLQWSQEKLREVEDRLRELLDQVDDLRFDPTPSPSCRGCDFLGFCDAGRRFVSSEAAHEPIVSQ